MVEWGDKGMEGGIWERERVSDGRNDMTLRLERRGRKGHIV